MDRHGFRLTTDTRGFMGIYTWGDTVRFKSTASVEMRPGVLAEIVGVRQVETSEQEKEFAVPIGSRIYLLEYQDGSSIEVSEEWIERLEDGAH